MMNIGKNERDTGIALTGRICDKRITAELSNDFTVPDTQPEIRKILAVTERLLPPAKYVGGATVECNGVVDYRVIYLSTDGELWGACYSAEYELEAPVEKRDVDTSAGVCTLINAVCEGSSARVSGGRRVNIRSRISADIQSYGEIENGNFADDDDDASVQRLCKEVECGCFCTGVSDVIEVSEEIGGLYEDSRVITADANAYIKDVSRGAESIACAGELTLILLVCREGQRAEQIIKKVPFEGVVELDRPVGAAQCKASCYVTDVKVSVEEGRADCTVSAVISVELAENQRVEYTADAYSTEREWECDSEILELPSVLVCGKGNFSQNERLPLSETSIPEGASLVEIFPRVMPEGCEYKGKYEVSGRCVYTVLWEKEGEYGASDVELPVKYAFEGREGENISCAAKGEAIACRGRIDGELLCIDAEIIVDAMVTGRERVERVRDMRLGEPFERERNRMVVYYPAEGETPWEVAKKYHVRADSLSEEKNYYLF